MSAEGMQRRRDHIVSLANPSGRAYRAAAVVRPFVRHILRRIHERAVKRGYASDITVQWLAEAIEAAVAAGRVQLRSNSPWTPSVDQLTPGLGYVQGNVQVVPLWFNYAKHDFDECEVREAIKHWAAQNP